MKRAEFIKELKKSTKFNQTNEGKMKLRGKRKYAVDKQLKLIEELNIFEKDLVPLVEEQDHIKTAIEFNLEYQLNVITNIVVEKIDIKSMNDKTILQLWIL